MTSKLQIRYKFRTPDELAAFIRKTHPLLKKKIKSALKLIASDPGVGKSLKDDLEGLKSFRIGRFRIIYRISSKYIVDIIAIGPRKIIYEETYKIIMREKEQE